MRAFAGEMKLVVTIPAYNEEETIGRVIAEIPKQVKGVDRVEVLVIDDGSIDGTVEQARRAGADRIVSHKANQGLGVAFKTGLDSALEMGADIIVNIDADGQHNATEIPKLIRPILENKADMVLGWRDLTNQSFMPRGKKIGNKLATWVIRKLTGLPIKDAQTGFRAFSAEAALRLNLSGKYTYVQETLIQAGYKGLKIEQVPIEFRERRGESRLISSLASYALKSGGLILRTYRDYRPLRLFTFVGSFLILIGLAFGIRVVIHFARTGMVSPYIPSSIAATLLIITGLLAVIFGLFADMFKSQRLLEEEILYRLKKEKWESQKNYTAKEISR
jgi:glycosyltransferase involved in cell wall biosynthesis